MHGQETRMPSEMCVGEHVSLMDTRIPSDICAWTHASLGMRVQDTLYPGNTHHYDTSPNLIPSVQSGALTAFGPVRKIYTAQ